MKVTTKEIELLAVLLARAGLTDIEVMWANDVLNKLRALVAQPPEDEPEES